MSPHDAFDGVRSRGRCGLCCVLDLLISNRLTDLLISNRDSVWLNLTSRYGRFSSGIVV